MLRARSDMGFCLGSGRLMLRRYEEPSTNDTRLLRVGCQHSRPCDTGISEDDFVNRFICSEHQEDFSTTVVHRAVLHSLNFAIDEHCDRWHDVCGKADVRP